jgi:hypothetical protein
MSGLVEIARRSCFTATRGDTQAGDSRMTTTTFNVSTETDLPNAIFQLSNDFAKNGVAAGDYVVNIDSNITLAQSLPMIRGDGVHTITINGLGHTIDANEAGRVFFVESGKVNIDNVTISHALAEGGAGGLPASSGGSGGGGLGAGAALFVRHSADRRSLM